MQWKTVNVFISSTFNDMHAERDRLVKRVFPELRLWCARRKLKLRDIDLRWGVSAADAQENKRVVEVCLRNIDRCRPFFLCFMGQRRGWVPGKGDVNPETLEAFPMLKDHIGSISVTELEILHSLLQPLDGSSPPVRHSRFYFRDAGYAKSLTTTAHKDLFLPSRGLFRTSDRELEAFKKRLHKQFPTVTYTAKWNPKLPSPELTGELSVGRLEDFRVGNETLEADVLRWLKEAIEAEFPDHREQPESAGALEQELDRQDTQLFQNCDGYIPRPKEEQALTQCLEEAKGKPVVLLAQAGCGKTSLLAQLIAQQSEDRRVYYRFVGTTPQSFRLEELSVSLVEQWIRDGLLPEKEREYLPSELKLTFPNLCVQAAESADFLLVLDGMDQLLGSDDWVRWLPKNMPAGSALLVSLREGAHALPENVSIRRLGLMTDEQDKTMMVSGYLSGFLKDVDEEQLGQLLKMEGSSNPLYMKIVLNELRQHGSFDTLMEQFRRDYGSTPLTAFGQVLERVDRELQDTFFSPNGMMLLLFGCLAFARQGLAGEDFICAGRMLQGWDENVISDREILDNVYGLARELEPFLILDGDRIAIRYDSLRRAIRDRYVAQFAHDSNILLARAMDNRLEKSHDSQDAQLVLTHVVDATEDFIRRYFRIVPSLMRVIRHGEAQMLAQACFEAAQKRGLSDFEELGLVISKTAARLDTNPDTLFMELERYGDPENPAIRAILDQKAHFKSSVYLHPRNQETAAWLQRWEKAFPEPNLMGGTYAEPYFAMVKDHVLKVLDLRTRNTVNVLNLAADRPGCAFKLTNDGNTLFVTQWRNSDELVSICRYTLPELQLLERINDAPSHGTPWALHGHNGKLYGLQYRNVGAMGGAGRYTLSCLSSGAVLFRQDFSEHAQYQFCGPYFVLRDAHSGDYQVIFLENGKVLFRDRYLGKAHVDPAIPLSPYGRLFAGTANLYAAMGAHLLIWFSGSEVGARGEINLMQRLQKFSCSGEELVLTDTIDDRNTDYGFFAELEGKYIISESRGVVSVLDEKFRPLGRLALGEEISGYNRMDTRFAMLDGQLLIFYKDKVRAYDFEKFRAALKPDLETTFVGRRDIAVIDSQMYVMDVEMERIDLNTLEITKEHPSGRQYWERYCPWNMKGQDFWVGFGVKTSAFTIKRPASMDRLFRGRIPHAERQELVHIFIFKDSGDDHIGMIVADKEKIFHTVRGERKEFRSLVLLTKPLMKLGSEGGWKKTDLGMDAHNINQSLCVQLSSVCVDGKPYLLIPNVYRDEQTASICVYDVLGGSVLHRQNFDLDRGFIGEDEFFVYPGGLICRVFEEGKYILMILDLSEPKIYRLSRWVRILTKDHLARRICLFDLDTRDLLILDLEDYSVNRAATLKEVMRPNEAVVLGQKVIICENFSDIVTILDIQDESKIIRQRLERTPSELFTDEATKTIAMLDSDGRRFFWKLEENE